MKLVGTAKIKVLTGLSEHQVREWTVRRKFVVPDQPPSGPGSRSKFSWRSVLQLRLLCVMHNAFGVELEAARDAILAIRRILDDTGFVSLWDCSIIAETDGLVWLCNGSEPNRTVMILRLNPHLEVLANEFGELLAVQQLPLFPVMNAKTR